MLTDISSWKLVLTLENCQLFDCSSLRELTRICYNNRVDVRGRKYVFGHFKMSSEKGQKHIYAQEHQLYCYYNNFRGHSEKYSKRYLERCQRRIGVYFTVTSLYKTINCRISFKLRQNTAKFFERIFASKFSKGE